MAPTKFVAKLGSTRAKPDGMIVVPAGQVLDFLHPLPVDALWGVGERAAETLRRLGLRTVGDLAAAPAGMLRGALGDAAAAHLHELAWGRDPRRVVAEQVEKSISAEMTFDTDVTDPAAASGAACWPWPRGSALRLRGGGPRRPDGRHQGPAGRLPHRQPVPDPAQRHRRGPGDLRHGVGAVRGAAAGRADPARRRPGRGSDRRGDRRRGS